MKLKTIRFGTAVRLAGKELTFFGPGAVLDGQAELVSIQVGEASGIAIKLSGSVLDSQSQRRIPCVTYSSFANAAYWEPADDEFNDRTNEATAGANSESLASAAKAKRASKA